MGKNNRHAILIFIFNCFLSIALAQQEKNLIYQIGFAQNLNSYQWQSGLKYHHPFWRKGLVEIAENFNSAMIQVSGNNNKWKDDQKLGLNIIWKYSPAWKMMLSTLMYRFTDKLSGIASDINTHSSALGFAYVPMKSIELISNAGFKYDNRLDQIDRGMTYNFALRTTESIPIKDYYNRFAVLTKGDEYSFRKNSDFEFRYQVNKNFQESTYDSLSVLWTKTRRDNYDRLSALDLYVESLEEENRELNHLLSYGRAEGFRVELRTLINNRGTCVRKFEVDELVDERSKTEFHAENEAGIFYQHPKCEFNCSLAYTTDEQKNEVPDSLKSSRFSKYFYYISPDYDGSRLTLSSYGRYNFSKLDTVQLKGAISIYRYDTPENNLDDRDEFRLNANLWAVHHFDQQLAFFFNGSVSVYHLVYLFGERSANNNWMRIFRIYPQIVYKPNERLRLSQHVEVLANYVDYDFEAALSAADIRSYVFRRFVCSQQCNIFVSKRSDIFIDYKFEIEENGKLNWDAWTEILLMNRKNHWLRLNLQHQFANKISVSSGVIIFKRIESKQDNPLLGSSLANQAGDMLSYGPTLTFKYMMNDKLNLIFDGMRRVIERRGVERSFINYLNVRLSWYH